MNQKNHSSDNYLHGGDNTSGDKKKPDKIPGFLVKKFRFFNSSILQFPGILQDDSLPNQPKPYGLNRCFFGSGH